MKKKNRVRSLLIAVLLIAIVSPVIIYYGDSSTYAEDPSPKADFNTYYNVSETQLATIQALVAQGHRLTDIRVAFAFLFDRYGKLEDLETLVKEVEAGASWAQVFETYDQTKGIFSPRSYDADYLDKLMMANISSDDIMICDKLSFVSGEAYDTLLTQHMEGESWASISSRLGVIGNVESLPRVEITSELLRTYQEDYKLAEDQMIEAIVLAEKFELDQEAVLMDVEQGLTEYEIMANYFVATFN